jgi:uncharacterized protein YegL
MALDITGRLIKILPQQSGKSAKGNWIKQEFIIETKDQYPKKVCFSLWGDKIENLNNLKEGDEVKVYFNPESREYNERWYTELRAWKLESLSGGSSESYNDLPPPPSFESSGNEEDLPF